MCIPRNNPPVVVAKDGVAQEAFSVSVRLALTIFTVYEKGGVTLRSGNCLAVASGHPQSMPVKSVS